MILIDLNDKKIRWLAAGRGLEIDHLAYIGWSDSQGVILHIIAARCSFDSVNWLPPGMFLYLSSNYLFIQVILKYELLEDSEHSSKAKLDDLIRWNP